MSKAGLRCGLRLRVLFQGASKGDWTCAVMGRRGGLVAMDHRYEVSRSRTRVATAAMTARWMLEIMMGGFVLDWKGIGRQALETVARCCQHYDVILLIT